MKKRRILCAGFATANFALNFCLFGACIWQYTTIAEWEKGFPRAGLEAVHGVAVNSIASLCSLLLAVFCFFACYGIKHRFWHKKLDFVPKPKMKKIGKFQISWQTTASEHYSAVILLWLILLMHVLVLFRGSNRDILFYPLYPAAQIGAVFLQLIDALFSMPVHIIEPISICMPTVLYQVLVFFTGFFILRIMLVQKPRNLSLKA